MISFKPSRNNINIHWTFYMVNMISFKPDRDNIYIYIHTHIHIVTNMVNFVVRECPRLGCYQLCPVAVIMSFICTQFNQSIFICLFI